VVDIIVHKIQSEGIQLVEWHYLLQSRRMNVPHILSDYSFLVPDNDVDKTSKLIEQNGLPPRTPSKLSFTTGGDMSAKGLFFLHSITASPECRRPTPCHLSALVFRISFLRNLRAASAILEVASLHTDTRAAPIGGVRISDADDAPLS